VRELSSPVSSSFAAVVASKINPIMAGAVDRPVQEKHSSGNDWSLNLINK